MVTVVGCTLFSSFTFFKIFYRVNFNFLANKLSLKIGAASGLLYSQKGNTFKWFGEDFPEPEERTVIFGKDQLTIDLNAEDGSSAKPVVFKKGKCYFC